MTWATEKLTGADWKKQRNIGLALGTGAAVGGLAAAGRAGGYQTFQGQSGGWGPDGMAGITGSTGSNGFSMSGMLSGMAPSMLGMAGNIYSADRLAKGQQAANDASIQSAREQMAFQERMSSTAHQREVSDLQAAGLNPVLSANAGASSPSGQSATIENAAPDYSRVVQSAMEAKRLSQELKESDSRIGMNIGALQVQKSQARANDASAKSHYQQAEKYYQEAQEQAIKTKWLQDHKWTMTADKASKYVSDGAASARDVGIAVGTVMKNRNIPNVILNQGPPPDTGRYQPFGNKPFPTYPDNRYRPKSRRSDYK